jgi:uncharacterized membrane protein
MALTVVLTFTPLGYIPVGVISITTIHVATILGACILGIKYGAILGGTWGVLCIIKAFQEPIPGNIPFQNPMISLVPRIIVGIVAAAVFVALSKTKLKKPISLGIAAVAATLTNTVLVLTALTLFNGFETITAGVTTALETIFSVLISVNGVVEIITALVLVPSLYMATEKLLKDKI